MGQEVSAATTHQLLEASKEGREAAFEALLDRYAVRLALFIRRVGGGSLRAEVDAEDVYQEVSGTAWKKLADFERVDAGSFYRWLTAIARNAIGNRVRYLKAKGRGDARHTGSALGSGVAPEAGGQSPSSLVAHREEIDRLQDSLRALAPDLREIIERHVLEEERLTEIAAAVGLSKSTTWERLQKGMRALKAMMEA